LPRRRSAPSKGSCADGGNSQESAKRGKPHHMTHGAVALCHDESMESVHSALEAKRRELEAELHRLTAPPDQASAISFGKRVGEGTSMAVDRLIDVEVHEQMQAQLADVRRAITKLDEDSYGLCDRCGSEIAPERLEVLPWAVLCVRCAADR